MEVPLEGGGTEEDRRGRRRKLHVSLIDTEIMVSDRLSSDPL